MTTLEQLQETMTDFLNRHHIPACTAWPNDRQTVQRDPLVLVGMKSIEALPAGFENYLGQVYSQTAQQWVERYGQRMTARFQLTLYSPEAQGETGCRRLLDQTAGAFHQDRPDGLSLEKWSMGETGFDPSSGMFRGTLQVVCRGMLTADADPCGSFLGFEVKGGLNHEHGNDTGTAGGLLGL